MSLRLGEHLSNILVARRHSLLETADSRNKAPSPAKPQKVWRDFANDSLPKTNRRFYYRYADCDESHNCGIARIDAKNPVVRIESHCQADGSLELDLFEACLTIEHWVYPNRARKFF